jgi:hypothetical protein
MFLALKVLLGPNFGTPQDIFLAGSVYYSTKYRTQFSNSFFLEHCMEQNTK